MNEKLPVLGHELPLYSTIGMPKSEWARRRRGFVGASQVGAILGWSPYESPLTAWEVITGRREVFATDPMHIGTHMEGLIAGHYADVTGRPVEVWPIVLRHPVVERMTCNLDRVSGSRVIEIKYAGSRHQKLWKEFQAHGDWDKTRGTSLYTYWLQVQAQLEITGLDDGELFAVVGEEAALKLLLNATMGTQLTVPSDAVFSFACPRVPEVGAWMADQVDRFGYWHIELDQPPPPTRAIDLDAIRRALAPEDETAEPEVRDDLCALAAEVVRCEVEVKAARDRAGATKARLLKDLSRYGTFHIGERKVIHRKDKNGRAFVRGLGDDS